MTPRFWPRRKAWPGAISTECPAFHLHPILGVQSSKSRPYRAVGRSVGSTGAPILIHCGTGSRRAGSAIPRRRLDANRFGVLYLGDSLKVCFLETVLRDRREAILDDLPIEEVELTRRRYAQIATTTDLRLVDLRGDNAARMGVPTDVVRAQRQNLARRWSLAFTSSHLSPTGSFIPRASMRRPILPFTIARYRSFRRSVLWPFSAREGWLRSWRISGLGWCEDAARIRIAWRRWL
ncbi:RES domain-containing protein [Mesorhizobium sp. M0664]